MGTGVTATLVRYGFYPPGGGRITVRVEPAPALSAIHLDQRGELKTKKAIATVVNLPMHIGERETAVVSQKMKGWKHGELVVESSDNARSPGNFVALEFHFEHVTEVFTSIGERGVTAETVAEKVVGDAEDYISSAAAVGPHLADQLLIPMALAGTGSFTTSAISLHTTTNIDIIKKFLDVQITASQQSEKTWQIRLLTRR